MDIPTGDVTVKPWIKSVTTRRIRISQFTLSGGIILKSSTRRRQMSERCTIYIKIPKKRRTSWIPLQKQSYLKNFNLNRREKK